MRFLTLFVLSWAFFALAHPLSAQNKSVKITWKKTVVDKNFRSEGVAVADINKDGKPDVVVGDYWYEAPSWKQHVLRTERKPYNPGGYSDAFALFSDDLNKDGHADVIVIGYPGKPCHWYENPGKNGGKWTEHMIQNSACNETPIYVDLLGTGQRGLILGHQGEMCFFYPGKDPAKPWERLSVSGPGKGIPGTAMYAHGNGAGDVNGDGKLDVLCNGGWWEQPASDPLASPWKFHPARFEDCADMYTLDVDGDSKPDVIASAAHRTGLWWYQQKTGKDHPAFVKNEFFPIPASLAKEPADHKFSKEESEIYKAIVKARADQKRVPWRAHAGLSKLARAAAASGVLPKISSSEYTGKILAAEVVKIEGNLADLVKNVLEKHKGVIYPGFDVGVGVEAGAFTVLIGDRGNFALPGQTHALHFKDINGDGLKDLITGRRWWAHGPGGDDQPADPAFVYWFKAVKSKDGVTTFEPNMIDDDSGVGTQFAVDDINGDGLLDIIISNKKGVFVIEQIRVEGVDALPPGKE